jgi:hypothetical protein
MAYVGAPYENDIFISYATESNDAGWVDYFRQRLATGLTNKLPLIDEDNKTKSHINPSYKVGIWFDQSGRMHGNHAVTKQLFDGVRSSATLIIIVSQHYWRSVWPIDERSWFSEAVMKSNGPNRKIFPKGRVFIVNQDDSLSNRPKPPPEIFFGDDGVLLPGYTFFDDNSKTIWPKTDNNAWTPSFLDAMESLVGDLAKQLWKIRHSEEKLAPIPPERPTVFLGHVNKQLTTLRTEVRNDLEQKGIVVLPPKDQDVMYDMVLLRSAFKDFLGSAAIFVQLLNENCGEGPPENPLGNIGLQLGLANAQPGLRILQFVTSLRPEKLEVFGASPEYQRYLEVAAQSSPSATAPDSASICRAIATELEHIANSTAAGARDFGLTTVGATSDTLPATFLAPFLQSLVADHPGLIPGIISPGSTAKEIRRRLEFPNIVILLWKDKSMDWLMHNLKELLLNPEALLNPLGARKRNIIVLYPNKPAEFSILPTKYYVVIDCTNSSEEEVRAKVLEEISSWLTTPPITPPAVEPITPPAVEPITPPAVANRS